MHKIFVLKNKTMYCETYRYSYLKLNQMFLLIISFDTTKVYKHSYINILFKSNSLN